MKLLVIVAILTRLSTSYAQNAPDCDGKLRKTVKLVLLQNLTVQLFLFLYIQRPKTYNEVTRSVRRLLNSTVAFLGSFFLMFGSGPGSERTRLFRCGAGRVREDYIGFNYP
jgi:hypothetical protein